MDNSVKIGLGVGLLAVAGYLVYQQMNGTNTYGGTGGGYPSGSYPSGSYPGTQTAGAGKGGINNSGVTMDDIINLNNAAAQTANAFMSADYGGKKGLSGIGNRKYFSALS